ncbi:MAG: hypothetical protein ACLQPH_21770 [Acidimicrobiales bacterium]
MLGRKTYTREELEHSKEAVARQLADDGALVTTIGASTADKTVKASLDTFEVNFFNNMVLMLDRYFVHRLRMVTGKDGNALNEVEMPCDSLMHNDVSCGPAR